MKAAIIIIDILISIIYFIIANLYTYDTETELTIGNVLCTFVSAIFWPLWLVGTAILMLKLAICELDDNWRSDKIFGKILFKK